MKLIQLARFVATPQAYARDDDQSINQRAEVEVNGIRLFSAAPKSAAEAEFINRVVQQEVRNEEQRGPG